MPGATALTIGAGDTSRLVVRATYGIVTSRDGGQSWKWICEQAVGVSGEADPPLAVTGDGTFVMIGPRGGLLLSRDEGCNWSAGPLLFQKKKTVDLAPDPADPARVVVLASTVDTIDDQGVVSYANLVGETRDGGKSFAPLGPLPSNFIGETLEVSPSNPARLYVSGAANDNPLVGVVLRSTDSGATWSRFTLALPDGSGSVFISAIDPRNPDRLWIRVPARGDTFGFFPASLHVSEDGGETFTLVARTTRAMFGFALSPDGTQLAYGGPFDGLYIGPSTGGAFAKVSSLGVRCLKWRSTGLYACASQPTDAFTVGLSAAGDGAFDALYDARTTCPQTCSARSVLTAACESTWNVVGPGIGASPECPVPWSSDAGRPPSPPDDASGNLDPGGPPDAGSSGSGGTGAVSGTGGKSSSVPSSGGRTALIDASVESIDGSVEETGSTSSGCSCGIRSNRQTLWTGLCAFTAFVLRRRKASPARADSDRRRGN